MSDIRIEHGLLHKPEVMEMTLQLGVSKNEVIGGLVTLWLWADACTRNGECDHDPKIIDDLTGITGFSGALEKVGWMISQGQDSFLLPRIERYTGDGRTSKDRKLTQQERARVQVRSKNGKFTKAPRNPTTADIQPIPSRGTGRTPATPPPVQYDTIPNETIQHTHSEGGFGDGDYTGADLPPARYYRVISSHGDTVNQVIDSIPTRHRRAPNKIKRAVAAALDRGVDPSKLADSIRDYYASDEGSSDFATWPANWIDQERYDEDPAAWIRGDATESNIKEIL